MDFKVKTERTFNTFELVYRQDEYSFDVEPKQDSGAYTLMINDLFIELDEDFCLLYVWGLCPLVNVESIDAFPEHAQDMFLQLSNTKSLISGVPIRINKSGRWNVGFNPEKGWVCIGSIEQSVSFIQFAPGSVLGLKENRPISLWLFSKELIRS